MSGRQEPQASALYRAGQQASQKGQPDISADVALRLGLSARTLTPLSLEDWLSIVIRAVGLPLTAHRLGKLRLSRLRHAGRAKLDTFSDEQLRKAIAHLRGHGVDIRASLPPTQSYTEGDMPGSIRVACASNRSDRIDAPFGSCDRLLVYQVSAQEIRLIDIRETADLSSKQDRYSARVACADDCHVLYALTIGAAASAKAVNAGLHLIKLGVPMPAQQSLKELQGVLDSRPPPWLMKIMERSARKTWVLQEERAL